MSSSTPQVVGSSTLSVWWYQPGLHEGWARGELAAALAEAGAAHEFYSDGADISAVLAEGQVIVDDVPAGVVEGRHRLVTSSGDVGRAVPYLFIVRVATPAPWDEPLRAWLSGEHFTLQLTTPGIEWSHGYEALEPPADGSRFLNIWGMTSADPPSSDVYGEIRDTPWYAEVVPAFAASAAERAILKRQR